MSSLTSTVLPRSLLLLALTLAIIITPITSTAAASSPQTQKSDALTPPVWPLGFNSTLIKIGPDTFPNDLTWTKLFFSNQSSRFDFYTSYIGLDQQWHCNFTILFTPFTYQGKVYPMIYHIYPDGGPDNPRLTGSGKAASPTCYVRANNIPNISRWWIQSFSFRTTQFLRGVPTQWWQLDEDTSLNYYNRLDSDQTPVRSTNQAEDPGATDYMDFMVGPQRDELFAVPDYCPPPVSAMLTESMYDEDTEWIRYLPSNYQRHVRQVMSGTMADWQNQ